MRKDECWKTFFSDNERYADIINGIGCKGKQYVKADDLKEIDTAFRGKTRDLLRKSAFGVNFAIIGIENQEEVDYKFPLRNLHYEVNQYEKQAAEISRKIRKHTKTESLNAGEYLYGFKRDSRLHPVVTFVLYAGKEPWDGPLCLHDIIDFSEIPKEIEELTADYSIKLIDIRRMKDTTLFKTDIKYVFDFIRCTEDKKALSDLVRNESYYQKMSEDAFEVVRNYGNLDRLVVKEGEEMEGNTKNMCKAILDWMEDSRLEGIEQNKMENARSLIGLLADEVIAEKIGLPLEKIKAMH